MCRAALSEGGAGVNDAWLPCNWHPDDAHHAVACNLVAHLDTLDDLFTNATWCDGIDMADPAISTDGRDEQIYRLYGIVFVMIDQAIYDLRLVADAVDSGLHAYVKKLTGQMMGRINTIWKHRNRANDENRVMHIHHHHGPYAFADAGATAEPANGLLVPGMVDAVVTLCTALSAIETHRADHPSEFAVALDATYPSAPYVYANDEP